MGPWSGALFAIAILLAGGMPPEVPPDTATCSCARAKDLNSWCELHGLGYVASVPIRSKLLWEVLDAHGHAVDLSLIDCPSCRRAIEEDGFCEEHGVGFVDELLYYSRLTYELGRGELVRPERLTCTVCRRHAGSHGWCEECGRGMVGNVAVRDRVSYEAVADALEILALANAASERCQYCAMAIVTDTECPFCHIRYQDGQRVLVPAVASPARDGP